MFLKNIVIIIALLNLTLGLEMKNRLSLQEVNIMLSKLEEVIDTTKDEDGFRFLVPGVIRLIFHDCIDGCDGCFNPDEPSNRRLDKTVNELEKYYQDLCDGISRVDFWTLAAKAAFNVGVKLNNKRCNETGPFQGPFPESCEMPEINIPFRYGRKDCPTSPHHNNQTKLPNALWGSDDVFKWFKETFNFSPNNAAAVMGMHTLGKAVFPSGTIAGSWDTENADGISNSYYKHIANPELGWDQVNSSQAITGIDHDVFTWTGEENGENFALNADMALFKNLKVDSETGESSCSYNTCGKSRSRNMFLRYAKSRQTWVKHIQRLFRKIIEKGERLRMPRK